MSDQPQHTALGEAVPLTKVGGGRPARVLSHQTLDLFGLQPLANPQLSAMTTGAPR
ncbi:MAG TPA: hypothetical protein VIZ70_05035 [Propionibacteriaceae bacterium]